MQAVILAGGRSRRLGGVPKAGLLMDGATLLSRTVDAASAVTGCGAGPAVTGGAADARIAVVGPTQGMETWLTGCAHRPGLHILQEDPPFAGPAAGIAAGLQALGATQGHVLVLACDMVHAGALAQWLGQAVAGCGPLEGVIAVDGGRWQPLAAIYPVAPLNEAIAEARTAHRLQNASVFSLLATVKLTECAVLAGLTADIDTFNDARTHGIAVPDVK